MDNISKPYGTRPPVPRENSLKSSCDDLEDELESILKIDIEGIEGHDEVLEIASKAKICYNKFSEVNFKIVRHFIDNGALSEANQYRQNRLQMKTEVKQFIALINNCVDNDINVSFNTTGTIPDCSSNLKDETIIRVTTAVSDLTLTSVQSDISPLFRSSSPNLNSHANREFIPPNFTHTCTPIHVTSDLPLGKQTIDTFSSNIVTEIPKFNVTCTNFNNTRTLPIYSQSGIPHRTTPTFTVGSSLLNNKFPLPFSTCSTSVTMSSTCNSDMVRPPCSISSVSASSIPNYPSFPDPLFSGYYASAPPPLTNRWNSLMPPITRHSYNSGPVTSINFSNAVPPMSSHIPNTASHNFGHRTNPPVSWPHQDFQYAPQPSVSADAIAGVLNSHMKNQLFQPLGEPFNGDPHRYHAWINVIKHRTSTLSLDPWEILTVLHANCTGKPKKIIEDSMNIGATNPQLTLHNVWNTLYERFGTGTRIASALRSKIKAFPAIKSVQDMEMLSELINICQLISVNMEVAEELHNYDLSTGISELWLKLPDRIQDSWRSYSSEYKNANPGTSPRLAHFISHLERKYRELSDPSYVRPSLIENYKKPKVGTTLKTLSSSDFKEDSNSEKTSDCFLHPLGIHSITECKLFRAKDFEERKDLLKKHDRCFRCLGPHSRFSCKVKPKCETCSGAHASAMHIDRPDEYPHGKRISSNSKFIRNRDENKRTVSPLNSWQTPTDRVSNLCTKVCGGDKAKSCSKIVLVDLSLPSRSSKTLRCYAILDEQSTTSFIDPKVVDFFDVDFPVRDYHVRTLVTLDSVVTGKEVSGLKMSGVNVDKPKMISLPSVLTSDFIPNCKEEIATPDIVSQHKHISYLAKKFSPIHEQAEVLLLVGRNCGPAMRTVCHGFKSPYAHNTPLGWALVGVTCPTTNHYATSTVLKSVIRLDTPSHMHAEPVFPLKERHHPRLPDIFSQSPDDEKPGPSKDDALFMDKVIQHIHVNKTGCITMPLPFRKDNVSLPDNKSPVFYRTRNTLSKLKGDPEKLRQCINNMQKNIDQGHVEEVSSMDTDDVPARKCWYLPVFVVVHPRSGKVRIVYDSAATYDDISLNSQLLQGPDITSRLTTVLLRFRMGEIGFSADIESMFYAFHLPEKDKDFVRFFWWKRNDPRKELVCYRATRHVFGNKSSPSLANIGLKYAVINSPVTTNKAKNFVNRNFYVDDGCGSADSVEEAVSILSETRASLGSYNIRLCKISSSSSDVCRSFPVSELSEPTISKDFNHTNTQRTLGVEWEPNSDKFIIKSDVPKRAFTKRGTLATTNSLFDPLGFVSPVVLSGRLLQRLFIPPKTGDSDVVALGWDDPLPEQYRHLWDSWVESLHSFDGHLSIPRGFHPRHFGPAIEKSLHIFSDASNEGIGYVVYLRTKNEKQEINVSLVCGSSKVPPRGTSSIPRLELCAAMDAAVQGYNIAVDIDLDHTQTNFYTDSKVVLGYISNRTSRFPLYITRRVNILLNSSSPEQWSYVHTSENPADVASRPQTFKSLTESCWFRGPPFLWQMKPPSSERIFDVTLPEEILDSTTLVTSCKSSSSNPLIALASKVDSWVKLVNVTKLIVDFIKILSEKVQKRKGDSFIPFQNSTDADASRLIIMAAQKESFPVNVSSDIQLSSLSPFFEDSLLKVGGRLKRSKEPEHIKYPTLLPSRSSVTTLIMRHFHSLSRHQGRTITTSAIRQAGFYIHHGSATVKRFLKSCIICRKLRNSTIDQKMSDLPFDRVERTPPFTYCGLDVFGPFHVSEGMSTRRNSALRKTWGLVFICLVSKAIHIEPIPHMDTSTFKNALRRFFCLRGTCKRLRSDRGTNFIGARNQDIRLDMDQLKAEASHHGCEWELNPPHSSHFGGIWERAIGSIRKVLDSCLLILGKRPPSRDELHTFLQEAASIINNTPMYSISNDPNDQFPLTPAQLLTMKDHPSPPSLEQFTDHDLLAYGPRRWRRIQALSDGFWSRWRDEYLQTLQKRHKWTIEKPNLQQGDIVILKIKGGRRNHWPLARVHSVHVSEDGLVRSATLALATSSRSLDLKLLERPLKEIVPIIRMDEVSDSE